MFYVLLERQLGFMSSHTAVYRDIWEKKPLLIHRHSSQHNDSWFSTKELDRVLHEVQTVPFCVCKVFISNV